MACAATAALPPCAPPRAATDAAAPPAASTARWLGRSPPAMLPRAEQPSCTTWLGSGFGLGFGLKVKRSEFG